MNARAKQLIAGLEPLPSLASKGWIDDSTTGRLVYCGYGGAKPLTPINYSLPPHNPIREAIERSPSAVKKVRKLQRERRALLESILGTTIHPNPTNKDMASVHRVYDEYIDLLQSLEKVGIEIIDEERQAALLVEKFLRKHGLIVEPQTRN